MAKIPEYEREVKLNGALLSTQNYRLDKDMFGATIWNSVKNLANSGYEFVDSLANIEQTRNEAKVMSFNNSVENWKQENLTNGYLQKCGEDASGKTQEVMKEFDDYVSNWKKDNKVNIFNQNRIDEIYRNKRANIDSIVQNHDMVQTKAFAQTEGQKGIDNAINNAKYYTTPEDLKTQVGNIKQISQWSGEQNSLDKVAISKLEQENVQKLYNTILDEKLQNKDITGAQTLLDENSNIFDSESIKNYKDRISEFKKKLDVVNAINNIYNGSVEKQNAFDVLESKDYKYLTDEQKKEVKSILSLKYENQKEQEEKEQNKLLKEWYKKTDEKISACEVILPSDTVNTNLSKANKKLLEEYIFKRNNKEKIETDNKTYLALYNKSITNTQEFCNMDLAPYRLRLSDRDYVNLENRQAKLLKLPQILIKENNEMIKTPFETWLHQHQDDDGVKELESQYISDILEEFDYEEDQNRKRLTREEIEEIVKNRINRTQKSYEKGVITGAAANVVDLYSDLNGDKKELKVKQVDEKTFEINPAEEKDDKNAAMDNEEEIKGDGGAEDIKPREITQDENQKDWRKANEKVVQVAMDLSRVILPEVLENWYLGSKEEEELYNKYNDVELPTYYEISKLYKDGELSQDEYKKQVELITKIEIARNNREYTQTRNKNLGKFLVEEGTTFIPASKIGKTVPTLYRVGTKVTKGLLRKTISKKLAQDMLTGVAVGSTYGTLTGYLDKVDNPLKQGTVTGLDGMLVFPVVNRLVGRITPLISNFVNGLKNKKYAYADSIANLGTNIKNELANYFDKGHTTSGYFATKIGKHGLKNFKTVSGPNSKNTIEILEFSKKDIEKGLVEQDVADEYISRQEGRKNNP